MIIKKPGFLIREHPLMEFSSRPGVWFMPLPFGPESIDKPAKVKHIDGKIYRVVYRDMIKPIETPGDAVYYQWGGNPRKILGRPYKAWAGPSLANGRSYDYFDCPWCGLEQIKVYIWSFSGGGKRCPDCKSKFSAGFCIPSDLVLISEKSGRWIEHEAIVRSLKS